MCPAPALLADPRVRAAYAEAAGIYRILPRAVALPDTVEDVIELVGWAAASGTPLIPRGAGSGMPGHNVGPHVIVDLSRAFGELVIDPERRIARAGASVSWAQVTGAARAYGLRLPPDPSSGAFATSGGMVSTNAAGPRSVRHGSVRPWVDAIEVVGTDGTARRVLRGGGAGPWLLAPDTRPLVLQRFPRTRKNSSGYALDAFAASGDELDLWIGAEGTLGIVTAVEWRLDPIPPDRAAAALGFGDLGALTDALPFLLALNPSAVELMDATLLDLIGRDGGAGPLPPSLTCLLLVEFERETSAAARGVVGDAVRGLKQHTVHVETAVDRDGLEHLWRIRRLASPALACLPPTSRSLQIVEDGCVPLEHLAAYVDGVRQAARHRRVPVAVFGHAGDGHVHVNAVPDTTVSGWRDALAGLFADVTDLVLRAGGTPSGEHGDGRLRAGLLERLYGPEVLTLFRELKHAYDPLSILNPGVIIPAADWMPLGDLKVGPDAAQIPDDIAARLLEVERNATWATSKLSLANP